MIGFLNNDKVQTLTGGIKFESTKESLSYCIETFLSKPSYLVHSWAVEGYLDRIANERTPLTEIPSSKQKMVYLFYRFAPSFLIDLLKR